jgi:hypothetical protein
MVRWGRIFAAAGALAVLGLFVIFEVEINVRPRNGPLFAAQQQAVHAPSPPAVHQAVTLACNASSPVGLQQRPDEPAPLWDDMENPLHPFEDMFFPAENQKTFQKTDRWCSSQRGGRVWIILTNWSICGASSTSTI